MTVYCHKCNENHLLTQGEAERVIYVLMGTYLDARTAEPEDEDPHDPDAALCLRGLLHDSHDIEAYAEFATAAVESRKHFGPIRP